MWPKKDVELTVSYKNKFYTLLCSCRFVILHKQCEIL
jgi:hypothetical protein